METQPYFAAFDAETGAFQPWFRPAVGSAVFAMQPTSDGGLLVGGEIDTWNGLQIGSLVKIDPLTGELWPGFPTRAFGGNSVVRDLKLESDGWVYAVGSFSEANEGDGAFAAHGAIRFDPITGDIDETWLPSVDEGGAAWGVSRSMTQDVTYIAGFFTSVEGDTDNGGFVGLDDAGAVVQDRSIIPFNGCGADRFPYCVQMYDVEATESGHLWVGGVEHALYAVDEASGELIQHHYTGCNPAFNDCDRNWYGGEFQEIQRDGDRIYATCHCWTDLYSHDEVIPHANPPAEATRTTIKSVAAFDVVTTDHIPAFAPQMTGDSGGFGLHVNPFDGCMWLAGGYGSYGAPGGPQPPGHDVIRICDETGPGPAAVTTAPPTPNECVVSGDADGVTVDWTNNQYAIATVIHRKVGDGNASWAGRVNDLGITFSGPAANLNLNEFFVEQVCEPGQRSAFGVLRSPRPSARRAHTGHGLQRNGRSQRRSNPELDCRRQRHKPHHSALGRRGQQLLADPCRWRSYLRRRSHLPGSNLRLQCDCQGSRWNRSRPGRLLAGNLRRPTWSGNHRIVLGDSAGRQHDPIGLA